MTSWVLVVAFTVMPKGQVMMSTTEFHSKPACVEARKQIVKALQLAKYEKIVTLCVENPGGLPQ